jgi:ribose transport system permease protein
VSDQVPTAASAPLAAPDGEARGGLLARIRAMRGAELVELLQRAGLTIAFVALVIYAWASSEFFMEWSNIRIVLLQSSIIAIVAVPSALLMLAGHVDFSIGSALALCAVVAGHVWHQLGGTWAILLALGVALAIGIINGTLAAWWGLSPIIVTLGGYTAYRGIANEISGGLPTDSFGDAFAKLGQGELWTIPYPVLYAVAVFVIGGAFLYKTSWGRHVRAIGESPHASFVAGISTRKLPFILYTATALAAGFTGLVQMSRLDSVAPTLGTGYEIDVLTAVLLGGVAFGGGGGSLFGVLIGILFLGVLNNTLILNGVSPFWQQIASGLALVFAAALNLFSSRFGRRRRGGLLGTPSLKLGGRG